MRRAEVPLLFGLLSELAPHGHRDWRVADASQLDAVLTASRISPEDGVWSIAFNQATVCGYSLTEPELNINRVVIGCAVTDSRKELHPALLSDAMVRALDLANDADTKVHIAVQEQEPPYVADNIAKTGFIPAREFLKMRRPINDVSMTRHSSDLHGPTRKIEVRQLRLDSDKELASLTRLHNACFEGSWGFSPNTYSEIKERVKNDHGRSGVPPILMIWLHGMPEPIAYVWTTLRETEGKIEMIGVSPDNRGRGLGKLMLQAGVSHLSKHGARSVNLEVDANNEAAVSLYESAELRVYSRATYYVYRA